MSFWDIFGGDNGNGGASVRRDLEGNEIRRVGAHDVVTRGGEDYAIVAGSYVQIDAYGQLAKPDTGNNASFYGGTGSIYGTSAASALYGYSAESTSGSNSLYGYSGAEPASSNSLYGYSQGGNSFYGTTSAPADSSSFYGYSQGGNSFYGCSAPDAPAGNVWGNTEPAKAAGSIWGSCSGEEANKSSWFFGAGDTKAADTGGIWGSTKTTDWWNGGNDARNDAPAANIWSSRLNDD